MSDYGAQDTSTTSLGANQFPISESWTPNAGFSAVEGGPQTTDAGGKKSAPVSVYAKDGSNVTQGAQADAAYTDGTGAASGTGMGLFKGIFVKLAAIATAIVGTLKVKGDFTEVAGQAAGSVTGTSTDLVPSTDMSGYSFAILQLSGTWTMTLQAQWSNDNFATAPVASETGSIGAASSSTTITANGMYVIPKAGRYLRIRPSAWTSNTSCVGTLECYTQISPQLLSSVLASQTGTWTVQPGNTANTTPWLVSEQVGGAAISNTNPVPSQYVSQSGYISLSSPPSATNVGTDTTFTFSSQINTVIIQNNTAVNVNYAFDTAATLGSLLLLPGQLLVYSKKVTAIHLLTAAAQNVNGSSASNIVLLGEL